MLPILRSTAARLIAASLLLAAGFAQAQSSPPQAATPNGQATPAPAAAVESVVVTGKTDPKEQAKAAAERARPGHCDKHPLERKNRLESLTVIQRAPSAVERQTMYDRMTLEHGCG